MELLSLIVKTAGVVVQALAVYVAYQALNKKQPALRQRFAGYFPYNRGRLSAAATRRWGDPAAVTISIHRIAQICFFRPVTQNRPEKDRKNSGKKRKMNGNNNNEWF